jgi:hypothetical protein
MKKLHQTLFIVVFLAIIGAVPVVQTCYEVATNPGHRVQLLDLPADIFVLPSQKAAGDAAMIDSVVRKTAGIRREAAVLQEAPGNTGNAPGMERLTGLCDEAKTEVTLLKKSVIEYNRHLQGGVNRWAATDTLTPYYRSLAAVGAGLDSLLLHLSSSGEISAIAAAAETLAREAAAVKRRDGGNAPRIVSYSKLTLQALGRILVGADYLRPYEKEMEKSSVFANAIRPWMLTAWYSLFGDLGSKGVRGARGWLFYRQDVDYLVKPDVLDARKMSIDPNDEPVADQAIDTIVSFKNQLAARGIDLLFVIMPTKPSIYPDLLNPGVPAGASGRLTHSLRMINELRAAGVEAIDLFAAFADERRNDAVAAESLYLRTDTHFKARGVRTTARVVADRVRQYPWFTSGTTEYAVDTVTVQRKGDIADMVDLPERIMPRFPLLSSPEPARCFQVSRIARDGQGAVADRTLYKDDYSRSPILVLGDSFSRMYQTDPPRSAGWIAHLALELGQPLASLVNDGGSSTLVREMLARKQSLLRNKKLVIWEVVERDFRFGEKGWRDVKLR